MKWYSYVICCVLIVLGTFFGIRLVQEMTSESYVNGSIDITNEFYQDSFKYSTNNIVFYPIAEEESYDFSIELLPTENFDGEDKEYIVKLNDYVLLANIYAGKITADVNMDFYDTEGAILCNGAMSLKLEFFADKTNLTLVCADENSANYFEEYFNSYGFRLTVTEVL